MDETNVQPLEKINSMSVARFLDSICEENAAKQRFCFILGSGASYTSGIKTGVALMKDWRKALLDKGMEYIKECALAANYDWEQCKRIFEDPVEKLKNEDYFTLYDIRFVGCPTAGYAALEAEMEGKSPNVGYYYLASILAETDNRLVITTNFDSLTEDALFYYSGHHPLVLGHEKLASYVASVDRKPVVAKIHRDLLMDPMSHLEQMSRLQNEWKEPLSSALSRYIPIVVGYAGGDQTLMSLLEQLDLKGIFWCTLDREGEAGFPEKARKIVQKNHGHWVRIKGFDELMYRMANSMEHLPNIKEMHVAMNQRHNDFKQKHEELKNKYSPAIMKDDKSGDGQDDVAMLQAVLHEEGRKMPKLVDYNKLLSEALAAWENGRSEEALVLYGQAIDSDPERAKGYDYRSTLYHRLGRYEEALADATKSIELEPENAYYLHSRAVTLHAVERYSEALADETRAIELKPEKAEYYHGRAVILHAVGRYKEALASITRAIELTSDNARFYDLRSTILHDMDRYEEALADSTRAIELVPDDAWYYNQRSATLHEMGRYEEALADSSRAIELDPDKAEYYDERSTTLHKMKRYDEALEDSDRAILLDPDNATYYNSSAITLREMGYYEEALADATKATELESLSADYWETRGAILQKMEHKEEAQECFNKAKELRK